MPTVAFVAYYAARIKLRTSWYAIAHVFPRADVLARLTEEQKVSCLSAGSAS